MAGKFRSFTEFYPFYLQQHSHRMCRLLHFLGTWLVLAVVAVAAVRGEPLWLLCAPVVGYGTAWVGHFFFERNRPATFKYPFYSLAGDWVMWKDIMIGKVRL